VACSGTALAFIGSAILIIRGRIQKKKKCMCDDISVENLYDFYTNASTVLASNKGLKHKYMPQAENKQAALKVNVQTDK
jgi:hypothetical protein